MIEGRGLSVHLAGRLVLDGVSLVLRPRELVGLIGPPEAGKTTLLKTLAGLERPSAGDLWWRGSPVDPGGDLRPLRQRIGMAFQNDALFDALSVFENVAFPLRRRRLPEAEVRARVTSRLADVGLEAAAGKLPAEISGGMRKRVGIARATKLPAEISGGMRKRVGIARATVIDPEIGLFDDPVAGLDPLTGGRILDLIVAMTERLGMSTVVVSNDLPVLLPLCRRVVMLRAGRVVYEGEPDGLATADDPAVRQFASGSDEGPL
jgi:phospholipid/cholesterol/gamma-HCH transport system ATP-binding protein